MFLGTCAGLIDIVTKWLSDIKLGVCHDKFWLNKESCCWDVFTDGDFPFNNFSTLETVPKHCQAWKTWSQIFGMKELVSE